MAATIAMFSKSRAGWYACRSLVLSLLPDKHSAARLAQQPFPVVAVERPEAQSKFPFA